MAATFGAATRTPFTSIVFLFELTQDYQAILPLMGTTVVAVLVTQALMHESLMTEKLARRGLRVTNDYEVDPTRMATVDDVMTRDVETIPSTAGIDSARETLYSGRHSAYPVVDESGACVGIVSRTDVLTVELHPERSTVLELASTDVVGVAPGTTVRDALGVMLSEDVEHLPVLDGSRLVGICTRSDVLRAKAVQFEQEAPGRGWLRR
jgi:CBS domain-containing protein